MSSFIFGSAEAYRWHDEIVRNPCCQRLLFSSARNTFMDTDIASLSGSVGFDGWPVPDRGRAPQVGLEVSGFHTTCVIRSSRQAVRLTRLLGAWEARIHGTCRRSPANTSASRRSRRRRRRSSGILAAAASPSRSACLFLLFGAAEKLHATVLADVDIRGTARLRSAQLTMVLRRRSRR